MLFERCLSWLSEVLSPEGSACSFGTKTDLALPPLLWTDNWRRDQGFAPTPQVSDFADLPTSTYSVGAVGLGDGRVTGRRCPLLAPASRVELRVCHILPRWATQGAKAPHRCLAVLWSPDTRPLPGGGREAATLPRPSVPLSAEASWWKCQGRAKSRESGTGDAFGADFRGATATLAFEHAGVTGTGLSPLPPPLLRGPELCVAQSDNLRT